MGLVLLLHKACFRVNADADFVLAPYQGFPLFNYAGYNTYGSVTVDECQYLCEISDLCRYFNYRIDMNTCFLKFGVGYNNTEFKNNGAFGHKYSSGKQITLDLDNTVHFS